MTRSGTWARHAMTRAPVIHTLPASARRSAHDSLVVRRGDRVDRMLCALFCNSDWTTTDPASVREFPRWSLVYLCKLIGPNVATWRSGANLHLRTRWPGWHIENAQTVDENGERHSHYWIARDAAGAARPPTSGTPLPAARRGNAPDRKSVV